MAYALIHMAYYSVVLLSMSVCIVILYDSANAQFDENTLESIRNQTGVSSDIAHISMGDSPEFIYGDPRSADIYVANSGSDAISVIDTTKNVVKQTIPVGKDPGFIVGGPGAIYVANSGSDTISVIDTTKNVVKQTIPVGKDPKFIYNPPRSADIYVATGSSGPRLPIRCNGSYVQSPDYIYVIDTTKNVVNQTIPVGKDPKFIYDLSSSFKEYLYVANSGSNDISVIDITPPPVNLRVGMTPSIHRYSDVSYGTEDKLRVPDLSLNTLNNECRNTMKQTIPVGKDPTFIYANHNTLGDSLNLAFFYENLYVANSGSDSVSVIDPTKNVVKQTIPVGKDPKFIYGGPRSDDIYVANNGSDTISVIDTTKNVVKQTIPVGKDPKFIYGGPRSAAVYVANSGSDSVSLINSKTNEVVAGVTFDIRPFRTGNIVCGIGTGSIDTPTNHLLYATSGTKCTAKPTQGFEFLSWGQNFEGNSTRTINATRSSDSPWNTILDIFGFKYDDPAATLTVNRFGNFTAYFRALPPPVPPEYWASLFTVVITALVGSLLIPAAVGWFKSKRQTTRLNLFHQQLDLIYADGGLNETDTKQLNTLNKNVSNSYAAGRINNEQYMKLKNEVSIAYQEIYKKRIDSLSEQSKADKIKEMDKIIQDLSDAYSKDKLAKLHYDLLNERISKIQKDDGVTGSN